MKRESKFKRVTGYDTSDGHEEPVNEGVFVDTGPAIAVRDWYDAILKEETACVRAKLEVIVLARYFKRHQLPPP